MSTSRYTSETLRLKGGGVHLVYDDGSVIGWAPTAELAADIAQAMNMVCGVRAAMGELAKGPGLPQALMLADNVVPLRKGRRA